MGIKNTANIVRRSLAYLALAIVSLLSEQARATPVDGSRFIVAGVYDPANPLNADTLLGGHWGTSPNIHDRVAVTCYYPDTVGTSICAGGGDFDKANCHGDNTNFGTIIKDQDGACWYRKNFGLNGVVDARQCGVIGSGKFTDQDAANLQNCLNLAKDNNIPVVNTGGGQIRDDAYDSGTGTSGQDILVPGGVKLTCGGTAVGLVKNNDYRSIQHAIILAGGHTIRPKINSDPGMDDGSSAKFDGCLILRADNGGTDTYAPSIFVPSTLREALQEVAHFAGTAISGVSESFAVSNTTVLGFDTCLKGTAARLTVEDFRGDCRTGFFLKIGRASCRERV